MTGNTELRPRLSTAWWGLLIRAFVAFMLLLAANFARIPLMGGATAEDQLISSAVTSPITLAVVVLGVTAWLRWVERSSLRVLGVFKWRCAAAGLAGGIALASIAVGLAAAVLPRMEDYRPEYGVLEALPVLVALAVVLQGIPEELIYRGWLFSITRTRPVLTFCWTTAAFTIIHLTSSGGQQDALDRLVYLTTPLGMGALAGAVALWRGSFWWAAGTHSGFHIASGISMLVLPYAQGRVAWITLGVAQLLVAAVVLGLWARRRREDAEQVVNRDFSNPASPSCDQ